MKQSSRCIFQLSVIINNALVMQIFTYSLGREKFTHYGYVEFYRIIFPLCAKSIVYAIIFMIYSFLHVLKIFVAHLFGI